MKPKNATWLPAFGDREAAQAADHVAANGSHGGLERLGEVRHPAPAMELQLAEPADQGAEMARRGHLGGPAPVGVARCRAPRASRRPRSPGPRKTPRIRRSTARATRYKQASLRTGRLTKPGGEILDRRAEEQVREGRR